MWTRIGNWYPLAARRARKNLRANVDGLEATLQVATVIDLSTLERYEVPIAA